MNNEARLRILEEMERMPQKLAGLVARVPEDRRTLKKTPNDFSVREQVHHLRDIEIDGFARRLELILSETEPNLPNLDGERLAIERRYQDRPHEGAIEELRKSRKVSVQRLVEISAGDWKRTGTLEGVGRIDVNRLLELWVEHDRDHLAQIERLIES
jgi:DinB superfamily